MKINRNNKKGNFLRWLFAGFENTSITDWLFSIIIAIIISIGFSLLFSIYLARDITQEQTAVAGRVLAHSSQVEAEVDFVYSYLNVDNANDCSPRSIEIMQKVLYLSQYIKGIKFIENNKIKCSALRGLYKVPLKFEAEPDYIKPNGIKIWARTNLQLYEKEKTYTIFKRGNFILLYDVYNTYEIIPGNYKWEITHRIHHKEYHFAGTEAPVFDEPITNWWTLIKSWVPTYRYCNARNLQCVALKIDLWRLFVNQTINTDLVIIAAFLIGLASCIFCLKYITYLKSHEVKVRRALRKAQFYCQYQPIIDLNTKRIGGAEVLARLQYKGENITPDKFIPVITEQNLSWPFTKQIIEKAFIDLRRLENVPDDFKISFNIFSSDVENGAVDELHEMASKENFNGKLCIEITESEYLEGNKSQQYLDNLHQNNIDIAIDDFGTGYSNMRQLEKINCDILKIDRSFIGQISNHYTHSPMVKHMVNIARTNNMKVIAEGVENKKQLKAIMALGIEFAQGFMFAKPGSIEDLNHHITTQSDIFINDNKRSLSANANSAA